MPTTNYSLTGTHNGQDFAAVGSQEADGYIYFFWHMLYRMHPSLKLDNDFNYVEMADNYQFGQSWTVVKGFKIEAYGFDPKQMSTGGGAVSPTANIESAVQWAIDIANDPAHGYDQANRMGPDYDCSSFVSHAYQGFGVNPGNSTRTMRADFTAHGFTWLPGMGNTVQGLIRGDVLLNEAAHTEMYIGNGQNVGAHKNEFNGIRGGRPGDQTGQEISVGSWYARPWDGVLRPPQN